MYIANLLSTDVKDHSNEISELEASTNAKKDEIYSQIEQEYNGYKRKYDNEVKNLSRKYYGGELLKKVVEWVEPDFREVIIQTTEHCSDNIIKAEFTLSVFHNMVTKPNGSFDFENEYYSSFRTVIEMNSFSNVLAEELSHKVLDELPFDYHGLNVSVLYTLDFTDFCTNFHMLYERLNPNYTGQ